MIDDVNGAFEATDAQVTSESDVGALSRSRLAANRRNARRSTGPRTVDGKALSRWNARTHGILSREAVIGSGEAKEDADEFRRISERFWEDLCPVGVLEEVLVEQIITAYWRQRRVRRAENGAIRAAAEASVSSEEQDRLERERELLEDDDVAIAERGRDLVGVESQLAAVDEARSAFNDKGFLTSDEIERVQAVTGFLVGSTEKPRQKLSGAEAEARRAEVVEAFDDLRARFEARRRELVARGKREREYQRQIAAMPLDGMMVLTRYEAHLERQFYKALHELERLQLRRAGEFVPPPVKVSVDIND